MAALDYSTDRLSALVISTLEDGGLSVEGQRLANTLASEAAQMISDIASSFPEFHRDSFAEVLKRESELIIRIDRIFEEIKSIRENANNDSLGKFGAIFEQNYRRSLARELDKIELFGMDTGIRQSSRQHGLSTAYISLSVTGGADVNADAEESDTDTDGEGLSEKKTSFSVRAEEAANLSELVVIKGEAGSGKTTLLQSLAVRCATASFEGEMEPWNQLIPFFIRLRALSGPDLPAPEGLPGLVTSMISGTMPAGWVHQQLQSGRGLILIDGLDEVSIERRDATRSWISSLLAEYPSSRIVVTSRPTAIPDGWLSQRGFKQLELLPMSPDDVSVFIDHWHDAVANEEQDNHRRLAVKTLIPALKERIRTDRALRELAATPLLCAMLCAMNRDRKQVLPTNRIALYDAAVQMILHGRDEERRIKVESVLRLDLETKKSIIEEIAFWMMQNGTSMADLWRVEDYVASIIPAFTKRPSNASSKEVVSALIQRSGVIRSPIEGKIDFVHNAFKEFLCAKAVTSGDRFGYLQTMLDNEAWREVAVLAAAMTDERRRADFITQLLNAGDGGGVAKATYHLLAVRCLETCTQLSPELQTGIKDRLTNLSAPVTLTEARSLSAAGELALPLLKRSQEHLARTAAACVRALRLIGTPEAMSYIKEYASDRRATVAKEVIAAWPFFDLEEYAREVLSESRGIFGSIRIDYPAYLSTIRFLKSIIGLTIFVRKQILNEKVNSDISSLTQLVKLSLFCSGSVDLNDFKRLENLHYLAVNTDFLLGLDAISSFNHLYRLSVSGKSSEFLELGDLPESLSTLTINGGDIDFGGKPKSGNVINELNINNNKEDMDCGYLEYLTNLSELSISNVRYEKQIEYIFSCSLLSDLRISDLRGVKQFPSVQQNVNLTHLTIMKSEGLEDIKNLSNFPNLKRLFIRNSDNLLDVSPIANLQNISELWLEVHEDASLDFLNNLPRLRRLRIGSQHYGKYGELSKDITITMLSRFRRPTST
ncbi:MAG: NACHT domain-containing protein [Pseudomonadota bacterium]